MRWMPSLLALKHLAMNKEVEDVIETMEGIINNYHTMNKPDGHVLNDMLRQLSSALYYLETVRSDYHDKWQTAVNVLVKGGDSVSRAENEAHVQYPEMYKLRRTISAANGVREAMRTNISFLKAEIN